MKIYLPFMIIGCLLLSVLFIPSANATEPSLYVNGVNMVDADPSAYPAGCTYDSSTNTLTLNNANLSLDGDKKGTIYEGRNILLNLVINGTNIITNGCTSENRSGIYIWGSLNVTGSGTLNVSGSDPTSSVAVYVLKDMTMSGGIINASGTDDDLAVDGNLTMTGGTFNLAQSGTCTTLGSITMSDNGALHATVADPIGYSIRADKGLTMTGGSIWGNSGDEALPQYGVNDVLIEGGDANISGGEIILKGNGSLSVLKGSLTVSGTAVITSENAGTRNAILAHNGMTVSGGTITAKSMGDDGNDVIVQGGNFTMTSGILNLSGKGTMNVNGNVSVSGGDIAAGGASACIHAIGGSVDVSGGMLEFGNVNASQVLVTADGSLNYHNGTLTNMQVSGNSLTSIDAGTASLRVDSGYVPSSDDFNRGMTIAVSIVPGILALGLFLWLRSRE